MDFYFTGIRYASILNSHLRVERSVLQGVIDQLDVRIMLRVSHDVLMKRRHERHGYHTAGRDIPASQLFHVLIISVMSQCLPFPLFFFMVILLIFPRTIFPTSSTLIMPHHTLSLSSSNRSRRHSMAGSSSLLGDYCLAGICQCSQGNLRAWGR